jgi:hypothetical protein
MFSESGKPVQKTKPGKEPEDDTDIPGQNQNTILFK